MFILPACMVAWAELSGSWIPPTEALLRANSFQSPNFILHLPTSNAMHLSLVSTGFGSAAAASAEAGLQAVDEVADDGQDEQEDDDDDRDDDVAGHFGGWWWEVVLVE